MDCFVVGRRLYMFVLGNRARELTRIMLGWSGRSKERSQHRRLVMARCSSNVENSVPKLNTCSFFFVVYTASSLFEPWANRKQCGIGQVATTRFEDDHGTCACVQCECANIGAEK